MRILEVRVVYRSCCSPLGVASVQKVVYQRFQRNKGLLLDKVGFILWQEMDDIFLHGGRELQ